MGAKVLEREKVWTQEEWLRLPEGPPYYELEQGRLITMPSPRREHQEIVLVLGYVLRQFAKERDWGTVVMEVDVALPTGEGYIPDLAFIAKEREAQLLTPDGKVHGAPDVVVEVTSPGTQTRDRVQKRRSYWEAGVKWYWLIDSEDLSVEEYRWTAEGYLCTAGVVAGEVFEPQAFPGLSLRLDQLVGKSPVEATSPTQEEEA